ncbi:hypothetical protein VKT23_016176 [Stygiomarasmius scandens]|uniref:Nephrocystin 3-like N-terminal domain-containing protein n=1 Tax=Marasmiellus scandens TaxID=2682957 RepID=A0ABR1IZV6_9AGAR
MVFVYYFDTRNQEKVGYLGLVSSLLCQVALKLIKLNDQYAETELAKLYSSTKPGQACKADELETTLINLLRSIESTFYIIIDALDEGEEQSKALLLFSKLVNGIANCHLFVSSGPHVNISQLSTRKDTFHIYLNPGFSGIESDIAKHVDLRLEEKPTLSPELKNEIKDVLVNSANGQFRWVDCQLSALMKIPIPKKIKHTLKNLPKTLEDTYEKTLKQIDPDLKDDARTILQWLIFSPRPLKMTEIEHILGVDLENNTFSIENSPTHLGSELHKIIDSTLIAIIQTEIVSDFPDVGGSETCWSSESIERVQLAHSSVKNYILSQEVKGHSIAMFYMDKQLAHEYIAQTCLIYILACGKKPINTNKFPLANYAVEHWAKHITAVTSISPKTLDLVYNLLNDKAIYLNLLKLYTPDRQNHEYQFDNNASLLYYAAFLGVEKIIQILLDNNADPNTQGGFYGTALEGASYKGHINIVKLLLNNKADPNIQGGKYGSALQCACLNGHVEIMKLLLDNRADPNLQEGEYGTALQQACLKNNIEIVKLLLDNKTDPNVQGGKYGTALQSASYQGHLEIVKLLLENKADPNVQGGFYGTPLQSASYQGHIVIVKLLLDNKADPNIQGGFYGTALQGACSGGHLEIAKVLLDHKAAPNVQGGVNGAALHGACSKGYIEIVELLLDKKADPNIQGGRYGTALQCACLNGHVEVVKLLLNNQADPNIIGGLYGTALQGACSKGYEEIVKLLLNNKADPNIQGGIYGTALQTAQSNAHIEIVKLLMDIDVQGDSRVTAL